MSKAICQSISTNLDSSWVKLVWASGKDGIALCSCEGQLYLADVNMETRSVFAGGYPEPVTRKAFNTRLASKIRKIQKEHREAQKAEAFFGKIQAIKTSEATE